jgi:hypothetical protein
MAKVHVTTTVLWNSDIHTLQVKNEYAFRDTDVFKEMWKYWEMSKIREYTADRGIRTPLLCPHRYHTKSWLRRFFREVDSADFSLEKTSCIPISDCECFISERKGLSYRPLEITVYRDLGGVDYPVKSLISKSLSRCKKSLTKKDVT